MRAALPVTAAVAFFALVAIACDPVHSDAVSALGGEAPGVRSGPTHRAGQPCLLCHDGALGNPPQFTVAGTVYVKPNDASASNAANGASVQMTAANGSTYTAETNQVGNFYVTPGQWTPTYPMKVTVVYQGLTVPMQTHIGRDGSCSGCHLNHVAFDSPGPIAVAWPDGGVP